jgi:hypothetical protein
MSSDIGYARSGSRGTYGMEDQGAYAGRSSSLGRYGRAGCLQPHAAEELSELLALTVVKAEGISANDWKPASL